LIPRVPTYEPLVQSQTYNLDSLPAGSYTWQITADYGGAYETAGLRSATVTVAAPPPPPVVSGRYRISILGFQAIAETSDDLLSRDGKNNEVYAAAVVCTGTQGYSEPYDPKIPTKAQIWYATEPVCSQTRSAIHGDVNGFPGRVKAGSGSASGGITSGDMVGTGPSGTTGGSTTTFPFKLWEGNLTATKDAVWIAPSLWERGGVDDEVESWDRAIRSLLDVGWEGAGTHSLSGGFVLYNMSNGRRCGFATGSDRPIGLAPPRYQNQTDQPGLICNIIGITREKAEAVLNGAPQESGKPAGVLTMDLTDALSGHYVMWLKIERIP
jgi:hypothetical protein